jgi:hypothetical protein
MPFIDIGSGDDLVLSIPTRRTENWNDEFKTNFALVIAEHDHSGSGNGRPIAAISIDANAVTGAKIRLANNEELRARNNAGSADINILKVTTADKVSIETDISQLNLVNSIFLKGRNNADSAYINMFKVNASDQIEAGTDLKFTSLVLKTTGEMNFSKAFVLTNNQAVAADITGALATATAGRRVRLHYSIYRDATTDATESGTVDFSYTGAAWVGPVKKYNGDNAGITFSITAGGQIQYTSTDLAGHTASTIYFRLETIGA